MEQYHPITVPLIVPKAARKWKRQKERADFWFHATVVLLIIVMALGLGLGLPLPSSRTSLPPIYQRVSAICGWAYFRCAAAGHRR